MKINPWTRTRRRTHAPGTRINTFFPGTFEKLTLSSRSLILISTSGTASPALTGEAEAREAKAWWAAEAVDARTEAEER